jgi:carboxymethylenebutenolidase
MANISRPEQKTEFVVEPKRATACVVVFHEVWGLVEHTEDVCKRVGRLGFAATAPNLYKDRSDVLTPANIQEAMEGLWDLSLEERRDKEKVARSLDRKGVGTEAREVAATIYDPAFRDRLLEDAVAAVERAHKKFSKVSTLGFCMGGALSLKCATRNQPSASTASPPQPKTYQGSQYQSWTSTPTRTSSSTRPSRHGWARCWREGRT